MAHIINLAAQKILGRLRCQRDENELEADLAEADGFEGHVDEASPEIVLKKVRCVVAKVRASHNLAEALEREATAVNLKYLRPKMDMRVRWNSTYAMIDRFLYLRRALERLFTFSRENKIEQFVLNDAEWTLLERLQTILKIFVEPTVHLSGSKYPTLHLQLPYYSLLLRQLSQFVTEEEERNNGNPFLLSRAVDDGWEVLNEYWKKTDDQTALVLSMILDPRCKLTGLERLGWTPGQVRKAKTIFERIYRSHYAKDAQDVPEAAHPRSPAPGDYVDPFQQIFGPEPGAQEPARRRSETAQWLEEPVEPWNVDGIEWWKLYGHRYPRGLADMARNYLAVPASSVPAERLFSRAGIYILPYHQWQSTNGPRPRRYSYQKAE
jgi:hypothetical protein